MRIFACFTIFEIMKLDILYIIDVVFLLLTNSNFHALLKGGRDFAKRGVKDVAIPGLSIPLAILYTVPIYSKPALMSLQFSIIPTCTPILKMQFM